MPAQIHAPLARLPSRRSAIQGARAIFLPDQHVLLGKIRILLIRLLEDDRLVPQLLRQVREGQEVGDGLRSIEPADLGPTKSQSKSHTFTKIV